MKKTGKIVYNDNLVRDIYKMTFDMGECDFRLPGQYAMIEAGKQNSGCTGTRR